MTRPGITIFILFFGRVLACAQQAFGCLSARVHGATHAPQEERFEHTSAWRSGTQQVTELLRQGVGILQIWRQADGIRVAVAAQLHPHWL